jgi:hypothetical protein
MSNDYAHLFFLMELFLKRKVSTFLNEIPTTRKICSRGLKGYDKNVEKLSIKQTEVMWDKKEKKK